MHALLRRSSALLLPLLLVGTVACSGSSDGAKEKGKDKGAATTNTTIATSTTEPQPLDADQVDASASPYCAVWADIRKAGGPKLTGDPAKDAPIVKEHYGKLVPLTEDLLAKAPKEIADAVKGALAQVQDAARTGSMDAFNAHGGEQVSKQLTAYAAEHCTKG